MKNIRLHLLLGLFVSCMSISQTTKNINYKMRLNAIPVLPAFSPNTDKILVRGSDKILKEVDRAVMFPLNPLATPDLQTVLTNGNTYSGTGTFSENYMQLSNSYPFSEKITFSADKGLEFDAGTVARSRLTHGALIFTYNGFTTSLVAPTDGNSGGGGVLTLPAVTGNLTAIMQGYPANPNNFGKLGLMMTDGTYLYICISQGVWKKVALTDL